MVSSVLEVLTRRVGERLPSRSYFLPDRLPQGRDALGLQKKELRKSARFIGAVKKLQHPYD
jgi:hypothetical protein